MIDHKKAFQNKCEFVYRALKSKNLSLYFVVAGTGASLFELFKIPGCSAVMYGGEMLYESRLTKRIIGENTPFVSESACEKMLYYIDGKGSNIILSMTGAVSTNRERKGENKACIGIQNNREMLQHQHSFLILGKTREEQDYYISEICLDVILDAII